MPGFDSVLIANRGEIVVRIARSARALGLKTVAVASDADRRAPYLDACDSAVVIGGERPADSYLRIDQLLHAARTTGADAVHPGYGFLAESAAFAQAVVDAGLVWIGPSPVAMLAMADKSHARRRIAAAGLPVLPGYDGADQQRETLRREAQQLGLPLMVKAAAGGGGRGMRLVTEAAQLDAALDAAASEALAAFGDARLLLERALVNPRHVEVQVFADVHGHVIHLGERDCSVQRRHQKLIEEAPSPAVTHALRRRLGEVAVAVAREVGYVGAGTVEFLLEPSGEFWFMEMNTRLQVEHAVTEALTGLDLVEWQFRVASREVLPLTQAQVLERFETGGHAIEARLCAEDAARNHLPQAGRVRQWQAPRGVRCDHALATGCEVSPFYDSMLAKVIAQAPTRDAAIHRLADALDRTVCLGLTTNRGFLAAVLRHPAFAGDAVGTAFLAEHFGAPGAATAAPSWLRALAAASNTLLPAAPLPRFWAGWGESGAIDTNAPIGLGDAVEGWRLVGTKHGFVATCGSDSHRIEDLTRESRGHVHATVDGRPVTARCTHEATTTWWLCEGSEFAAVDLRLAPTGTARAAAASGAVHAPMHGRITQVLVVPGGRVEVGALLVVIEAMKMEHRLLAAVSGTVGAVHARVGDQVAARQLLVEITA